MRCAYPIRNEVDSTLRESRLYMSAYQAVTSQLVDELEGRAHALGLLLSPDEGLAVTQSVVRCAPMLAAQLCQDTDDRLAAQTAIDIMCALWPDMTEPPPQWWRTPVGRMVARSIGADDADAVTHSVAAAMLGIPRGSIGTLVHRGQLDRHPDGGVTRASVMMRLAR